MTPRTSENESASVPPNWSRREFLALLSATMAYGAAGCRRVFPQDIVPYVERPAEVLPGAESYYATSMVLDGHATGLLVKTREGRPIKVEGNPQHPASLGAAGPFEQASVLGVYDPSRIERVTHRGAASSWNQLLAALAPLRASHGDGVWILMLPTSSPFMGELIAQSEKVLPGARFAVYSAAQSGFPLDATRVLYGRPLHVVRDFRPAEVVLALDSDFLASGPFCLRYARQWAQTRQLERPSDNLSRLYAAESMFTATGSMADHRLAVRPSEVGRLGTRIAAELLALGHGPPGIPDSLARMLAAHRRPEDAWVRAVSRDLSRAASKGAVLVGDRQPVELHVLGLLLERALGNAGRTSGMFPSTLIEPVGRVASLVELVRQLQAGKVKALVILGGNPAYTAPADFGFPSLLKAAPLTVYWSEHDDETAAVTEWLVPAAHFLESWGDARAFDGTVSFVQPTLVAPGDCHSAEELMAALLGDPDPRGRHLLREFWRERGGAHDFEAFWQDALANGMVAGSAFTAFDGPIDWDAAGKALDRWQRDPSPVGYEINFLPDPAVYDGRFSNNAWLLELPKPLTQLCWGNPALVGPETAARLGVENQHVVELELDGRRLRTTTFVLQGHAEGTISLQLGYGRQAREPLAHGIGHNAYALRTLRTANFGDRLQVRRAGDRAPYYQRQLHQGTEGRDIAPIKTLARYREHPEYFARFRGSLPSLMAPYAYVGDQWVMTIDTGICTGCSACVIACQAENNVPVVGPAQVWVGREMHWLRVDFYYQSSDGRPGYVHQPLPCQHCETAPCEYVCPVHATVHSPDGLNEMVYNRCVGTRFCSNNCPYKVRRWNWFDWYSHIPPLNQGRVQLQRNPEVTVRDRGVMEKCTYCVQRIRRAQIKAKLEHRSLRPGEVMTACQQACPTGAIAFASWQHRETPAVRWREQPRAYELLHTLGTRPRTWYLAKITNPNPELG